MKNKHRELEFTPESIVWCYKCHCHWTKLKWDYQFTLRSSAIGLDKLPEEQINFKQMWQCPNTPSSSQVSAERAGHEHQPLNHCTPRLYHPVAVILPNIEGNSLTTSTSYLCCWPLLSYTIAFLHQRGLRVSLPCIGYLHFCGLHFYFLLSLIFFFQLLSGHKKVNTKPILAFYSKITALSLFIYTETRWYLWQPCQ